MENQKINIKKNYRVPETYFDTLEETIVSKTINQPHPNTRRFIFPRSQMSIAAAIIILCSLGAYWIWNQNNVAVISADQTEVNILDGMEEELFAALFVDDSEEENALDDLADFLIELEAEVDQ